MATFRERSGSWRAEVKMRGFRASDTFPSKREAMTWAKRTEREIERCLPQRERAPKGYVALPAIATQRLSPPDGFAMTTPEQIVASARPVPSGCGVYFLIDQGEIVYIGKAKELLRRHSQHVGRFQFDAVAFIPCAPEHLSIIEAIYIANLKPRHNRRTNFPVQRHYLPA